MLEPSTQLNSLITAVAVRQDYSESMQAVRQRESEFANPLEATLTGIALNPTLRTAAEQALDTYWSDESRHQALLASSDTSREVIIGSGYHAAVYAAVRVLSGFPRPLVLERSSRAGGTFAMTHQPTFYLNSRNRTGTAGLAGDLTTNLNYLPGAPIQAPNLSMAEYQNNTDMAFVIRIALAQFADVVTNATAGLVEDDNIGGLEILLGDTRTLRAGRIIDARGLGDPIDRDLANGTTILTFAQFMKRMAEPWPLRGLHQVAVVGGGDAAKCAVESCLGIAPQPMMAAAALDTVEQLDWYAEDLPKTCNDWQRYIRGRYQAIGRYLRPDRLGRRRLTVLDRRARPIALPGRGLIGGRTYDLVVLCSGNRETSIEGLEPDRFEEYPIGDGTIVAEQHTTVSAYRVGPLAMLPLTVQEREDGVADIAANAVSMYRTGTKTAALAAILSPATRI